MLAWSARPFPGLPSALFDNRGRRVILRSAKKPSGFAGRGRDERSCPTFYLLSLSRISHHKARLLSDPLIRRSRQLQCHRRRIISLVADGLEVTSGNCFSDELFAQVISFIPESCRLFPPARPGLARWRSRLGPAPRVGDYSLRAFPQVGGGAGVYRRQPRSWGGTDRAPSPVPAGTRLSGALRAPGNNRRRR